MKKLPILAMIALTTVSAHAQNAVSFQINGRTIHLGLSDKCDGDHCLSISTDRKGGGEKIDGSKIRGILSDLISKRNGTNTDDETSTDTAQEAPAAPAAAPAAQAVNPPVVAMTSPEGSISQANPSVQDTEATQPMPQAAQTMPRAAQPMPQAAQPMPQAAQPMPRQEEAAVDPAPVVEPAPQPLAVQPRAVQPRAVQPSIVQSSAAPQADMSNTPVGIWRTEKKEGRVHIVPCGVNYCGYVVDAQTNRDGEKVLIDMKTTNGKQWSGHVHDPKGGGTYDATMSLKSSDALAIRGCAFGGMICRGQTWSRT